MQVPIRNATDHGRTFFMMSASLTWVATAAMASDCGLIILPTTPPMVLAARKRSGVTFARAPLLIAAEYCRPANKAFALVSEPVTAVPTQPSSGEMTGKAGPEPERSWPMLMVWPLKFMT